MPPEPHTRPKNDFHGGVMTKFSVSLLAGAALIALSSPGLAQTQKTDARVDQLEQQLRDVERQLAEIKAAQAQNDPTAAVVDRIVASLPPRALRR